MRPSIQNIGLGFALPLLVSSAITLLLIRSTRNSTVRSTAGPLAFAAGYCLTYFVAQAGPWIPMRNWHWTPYVSVCGALLTWLSVFLDRLGRPLTLLSETEAADSKIRRTKLWSRWVILIVASAAIAWLLVPTWKNLSPSRTVWIAILTAYILLLSLATDELGKRTSHKVWTAQLCLAAITLAIITTARISVTYGYPLGIAAAAVGGCLLASACSAARDCRFQWGLVFAATIGGWSFLACIVDPKTPLLLMAIPVTPLGTVIFRWGPFRKLVAEQGATKWVYGIGFQMLSSGLIVAALFV